MNQFRLKLTDDLFSQVVAAIAERTGNVIGQKQVNMIESRLTKRALTLGVKSEQEYIKYFKENRAAEVEELISLLTVHHTYFFREYSHFEFLETNVLPPLVEKLKASGKTKLRVWSAACSKGQEVYSLFMFIDRYLQTHAPKISVEVVGTDVDAVSVKEASNGVYRWDEVKEIPMEFLSNYWIRGTGDIDKFAKVKDRARKACSFKQLNLMETNSFGALGKFDVIFCRNVFIYFQGSDIARISDALAGQLEPGGFYFVGLSESLPAMPKGLKKRGPSIYGPEVAVEPKAVQATKAQAPVAVAKANLRVVCVDDSPVILKLLAAILTPANGFEIVGTAANGVEAAKLVEGGLKFDVMTLDVHMPQMTGVEYLEKKMSASHPPVVMLTSASRDNMDLAYKAMTLGAKDYIEKPSLNDLQTRADEIRAKLRFVSRPGSSVDKAKALDFDKSFSSEIKVASTGKKANVVFFDAGRLTDLNAFLRDRAIGTIPVILVSTSDTAASDKAFEKLKGEVLFGSKMTKLGRDLAAGKFHFARFDDFKSFGKTSLVDHAICYSVLTNVSRVQWDACPRPKNLKILLSEEFDRSVFLTQLSNLFVSPPSSFPYMASEFFGKMDLRAAG